MASSANNGGWKAPDRVATVSFWGPVATALIAAAIFVADTATPIEFSVSVLYVVVILMAGRFLRRRGTALVAAACVILAVTSAVLTPPRGEAFWGIANTLISIAAITITSFLVLKSQARELALKQQIEERINAEQELRERESRFRIFVDHATDAFFLHDEQLNTIDVNQQACRSLGYSREELIGMRPSDFDVGLDEASIARLAERVSAGETVTFESLHRRKDGTIFPIEARVRPFSQGSRRLFLGVARDITERKQAEEKIRQQDLELRQVLDFTPQLVAVFGANRERLYANRPALVYIGLTLEQWQGITDPLWFFHPDDRERLAKEVYGESQTEGPHEFEARFRRADGEFRWFLFRDSPLRDEQGRIIRWYLSAMDIEDRRRAEKELRNTADELQRVMTSVSDCLWSAEFDEHEKWTYQYYSPAVEKITGRPVSFFMHGPDAWFGIVHPEDKARVAVAAERLISGQVEQAEGEYRIIHANSEVRWIRDSGVVTRSGSRIRITGVVSDITARKRAEDELLRSEGYLVLAQRLTHTGSFAWDAKGGTHNYWSDEMFRIWGFDPEDGAPSQEKLFERIHPDDRDKLREYLDRALAYPLSITRSKDDLVVFADGTVRDIPILSHVSGPSRAVLDQNAPSEEQVRSDPGSIDFRLLLPNGVMKHVRGIMRPVLDQYGDLIQYVGTNVDITEQVRAERELRASEIRYRTIVDHAADAIMLRTDDGKLVDVNQYACESLGYTREELLGMTPRDFVDPNEDPASFRSIGERLMAGEVFGFESRFRRKDGTLLPVDVRVRPYWQGGQHLNLAIVRDITERKQAEQERERLRELEAELAHINRVNVIGEMTASIAHEINQPLSGVVSNGEACLLWLGADSPNLEEAREAVRRIVRDGTRAGEIISRIRGLVKKSSLPKTKLDLNETVREVIALLADEAKRRKITIQTEFAEVLGPVVGDRVQLQQVVVNLVMNAMDAMRDTVSKRLRITTSNGEPGQVCVAVQDTGVGLDPNNLTKIFDPFYSTKSGMGMGLSISRSIVQSHGGRLWAATNQDGGVTVQFTLPRYHDGASVA